MTTTKIKCSLGRLFSQLLKTD